MLFNADIKSVIIVLDLKKLFLFYLLKIVCLSPSVLFISNINLFYYFISNLVLYKP